jgi:hypothetical protein
MYLKISTILASILLTIVSCKTTDTSSRVSMETDQAKVILQEIVSSPQVPFKTMYVERTPFRFDFQGQMRSLRTSIQMNIDSFAHISLVTSLGISVAQLYVTPSEIIFIDFQEKKGYSMDYEYLSYQLQIPFSFSDIQMILLGYPFLASQKDNVDFTHKGGNIFRYTYSIPCDMNSDNFYTKSISFSATDKRLVQSVYSNSEKKERMSSSYKWSMKKNPNLPRSILVDFTYKEIPIGIDIEFKNAVYNIPLHIKRDSTILIKRLILNEDI